MAVTPLITHANQVRDEEQVYCDRDLVLQLLAGINKGTMEADGTADPLANLGTVAVRDAFIDLWMPVAAEKVESEAKQDFGYHKDIEFVFSGTGSDRYDLKTLGIPARRIVEVSGLTIDDLDIDEESYYVAGDGWLYYAESAGDSAFPPRRGTGLFLPVGIMNVKLTITWGYASVPTNIQMAAALFTCAYIVPFAEAFDSNTDDDSLGGDISVQMGDMRVTQKAGGSRYASFTRHCYNCAKSLCQVRAPRVRARMVGREQ